MVAAGLAAAIAVVAFGRAASADISLCSRYPVPTDPARALARATFAFDGVVVAGRSVRASGGTELVSPLSFRVTRWIKGSLGLEVVRIWDGRYERLPDRVLSRYSTHLGQRFPGDLVASSGQAWRIYGIDENGVNFTCANYLGSHPIESRSTPGARDAIPGPNDRGRVIGWLLVALGVSALAGWVITLLVGRRRHDGS